jgi:hypothetical protein
MSIETFHLNDYFYLCNEWVNGKLAGFFLPKEIDLPHILFLLLGVEFLPAARQGIRGKIWGENSFLSE